MMCWMIFFCLNPLSTDDSLLKTNEGLAIAVRAGNLERVKALLEEGVSPNAPSEKGVAPLIIATASGRHEVMKLLLAAGADLKAVHKDYLGATALMWAANNKDLQAGKILLAAGAEVNAVDQNGDSAINWSAYYGDLDFVKLLIEHKADPLITGHGNALEIAMRRGFQPLVHFLTAQMGKENRLDAASQGLVEAIEKGDLKALESALSAGADPAGLDRTGRPLLALAARQADANATKLLVEALKARKASLDPEDSIGFTPLMEALRDRREEAVELLLEAGANPNHRAKPRGLALTPAHMAAIGGNLALLRKVAAKGAKMDETDRAGNSPALWAVMENQIPAAIELLEMGADPERANQEGMSLSSAAKDYEIAALTEAIKKRKTK